MKLKHIIIIAAILLVGVIIEASVFFLVKKKDAMPIEDVSTEVQTESYVDQEDSTSAPNEEIEEQLNWIYDECIPQTDGNEYPVIIHKDTDHTEYYVYNGEIIEGEDEASLNSNADNTHYRARIQEYMPAMYELFNSNFSWEWDNDRFLDKWFELNYPSVRGLDGVVYGYAETPEGMDFKVLFFKSSIRILCHYSYDAAVITSAEELAPGPYYVLYGDFPGWWERCDNE